MRTVTARDVLARVAGELGAHARGDELVSGLAQVDSRLVKAGDLYVAIEGERVDGHDFAAEAIERGASLVLSTRDIESVPCVIVENIQGALERLARTEIEAARSAAEPPTVIALTGSSGKTSTKDLLASILMPVAETIAPVGSRNNELGLPLTVLELTESTRFLVLEMGARGIGHIDYLTSIVRPDIALVLNVGSAHVGEFGSPENIQKAKSELVKALDPAGVAVLNADDPRVRAMEASTSASVRFFSRDAHRSAQAFASDVSLDSGARVSFMLHLEGAQLPISLKLTGEHHVSNALAAALVARAAGVELDAIERGLNAAVTRSPGRMQVSEVGRSITLINDAYNANPESMTAALKALAHMGRSRRVIAVLGEMLELGEDSVLEHDRIGRLAVRLNIPQLVVVGRGARAVYNGASLEGSFGGEALYVDSLDEAFDLLEKIVEPHDVVLVKSSNGSGLAKLGERIVQEWAKEEGEDD